MYYLVGLVAAALLLWLVPNPYGVWVGLGLTFGGLLHLSDKLGYLQSRAGIPDAPPAPSATTAEEAERRRIKQILERPREEEKR